MRVLGTVCGALVMSTFGCGGSESGLYEEAEVRSDEVKALKNVTAEERLAYIQASHVWRESDIAAKNVFLGPDADDRFEPSEEIVCKFVEPEKAGELNGKTPKFQCGACEDGCTVGDTLKVKFGKTATDNAEIYGEVLSTRLLWALGFEADRIYPVRVHCKNCPEDPWKTYRDFTPNKGERADRTFTFAVVELKNDGAKIEENKKDDQGWAWPEIDLVSEAAGGAPRVQVDALRLLAAFMQHNDNKPENQRLICLPEGVTPEGKCTAPFMMIQDAGTSFGSTRFFGLKYNKAVLSAWKKQTVWKNREECQARLGSIHQLKNPIVTEEARQFLADLMAQLSPQQIRDLFYAARIEEKGEMIEVDGVKRAVTVEDWAAAFEAKRTELSLSCGPTED